MRRGSKPGRGRSVVIAASSSSATPARARWLRRASLRRLRRPAGRVAAELAALVQQAAGAADPAIALAHRLAAQDALADFVDGAFQRMLCHGRFPTSVDRGARRSRGCLAPADALSDDGGLSNSGALPSCGRLRVCGALCDLGRLETRGTLCHGGCLSQARRALPSRLSELRRRAMAFRVSISFRRAMMFRVSVSFRRARPFRASTSLRRAITVRVSGTARRALLSRVSGTARRALLSRVSGTARRALPPWLTWLPRRIVLPTPPPAGDGVRASPRDRAARPAALPADARRCRGRAGRA